MILCLEAVKQAFERTQGIVIRLRLPETGKVIDSANSRQKAVRDAGDIVLFSCASASKLRLGADAQRTTLIEPVNDVTGADPAPVKGGVAAKRSFEAVKRAALRKAPSPAALIPSASSESEEAPLAPKVL